MPSRVLKWPAAWRHWAAVVGPGLVVMLADNDAASVVAAAQSGAQWGYRLLLLQFALVPLMYMVQELAVRLALSSGRGFGELVQARFGRLAALACLGALMLSCFGALVTQFAGLAGVGRLFGVPDALTLLATAAVVLAMAGAGAYQRVERVAMGLGLFGLAFLLVAWRAHPDWSQVLSQARQLPVSDGRYLALVAANLGTSVMPWTVFYQQSALINKELSIDDLAGARWDTLLGALVCQALAASVLVAAAATHGAGAGGAGMTSVRQIADVFGAALGTVVGRDVFALGLGGCALVATVVVCLCMAWALGEAAGRPVADQAVPGGPWFKPILVTMMAGAATVVAWGADPVRLSVAVGALNAVLLPVVLVFLYQLARVAPNRPHQLGGRYAALVALVFAGVSGLGLYCSWAGSF